MGNLDHAQLDMALVLARVALLSGLKDHPEAFKALSQIMTVRKFAQGHTLINEGELGDEFFVLIEGEVSIYKKTPEGDIYKVAILKADVTPALGEGGLIESEPRSATVKCESESKFLVLAQKDFLRFCEEKPQWAVPILKKLALNLMGNLRRTSNDLMLLHKALMNEVRS
jgi:CRP/FNR family cyclic AMP-dependent transcriptional regulator